MAKIDNTPREPDPFEKADSPSAIMAYVFSKAGKDGLKALLSQVETDKESLERDADELIAIGLPDVAAIVMEAARDAPQGIDLCPYTPEDRCNWIAWQQSHQRKVATSRDSK